MAIVVKTNIAYLELAALMSVRTMTIVMKPIFVPNGAR